MSTWKNTDEYEDIDDNASNGFGRLPKATPTLDYRAVSLTD